MWVYSKRQDALAKSLLSYCKTLTMGKPLRLLVLSLLLTPLFFLNAQKKGYEPGYIITLQGDTLVGQVKDRSPEPFVELYPRIRFVPEGRSRRTKYSPGELLGYGAGGRDYVAVPLREEAAFFKFRYYLDPGAGNIFLRVIRKDGPLTYYHREFVYDDNDFLDFFPLIHREGEREMVRVTQGVLGLKRERLMDYFQDCKALVSAIGNKVINHPEAVYDFYLENCLEKALPKRDPGTILGNWEIDLRPDPKADPYVQEFRVTQLTGNTFQGYFYGSPLENARLNRNWDRLYFAFSTRDQNHAYYHSGYLLDGRLYGISYCPGREFVQPWSGVPK